MEGQEKGGGADEGPRRGAGVQRVGARWTGRGVQSSLRHPVMCCRLSAAPLLVCAAQVIHTFRTEGGGSILTFEFNPKELLIAAATSERVVRMWDTERFEPVGTGPNEAHPVRLKHLLGWVPGFIEGSWIPLRTVAVDGAAPCHRSVMAMRQGSLFSYVGLTWWCPPCFPPCRVDVSLPPMVVLGCVGDRVFVMCGCGVRSAPWPSARTAASSTPPRQGGCACSTASTQGPFT